MKQEVISALKWSALGKGASQVVSWVITIYVIRLLSPADYGLMAMVMVVIAFISTFNEFGLGAALIQSREISDEKIGAIYGATLLLGAGLSALLALASPLISAFFDEPHLSLLLSVAGLQFFINATIVVPESMMKRGLRFKPLSIIYLIGVLSASLTTLVLALLGHGVWALLLGNMAGAVVKAGLLIMHNPNRVAPNLRLRSATAFLSFGGYMTANRFLAYFVSQADVLIGAKLLGKEMLGLYTVALELASLPLDKVMGAVNPVIFSAVSRMQDKRPALQEGLLKAFRWMAYLTFPLIAGLAVVAPEFIPLVLGSAWTGAILPLQLISMVIPLKLINALLSTAVNGVGRADVGLHNTLVAAVVLPTVFLIGAHWGAHGLAMAWVVGMPVVFVLNFRRSSLAIGITARQVLRALWLPTLSVGSMVLALLLLRKILPASLQPWALLATLVAVGAAVFFLVAFGTDQQLRIQVRSSALYKRMRGLCSF